MPMTMTPPRRRGAALAAVIVSVALVLAGCGGGGGSGSGGSSDNSSGAATATTRSVKADNGTVKVPANPKRVAVLVNAVLPYLNLGGKPVAVTDPGKTNLSDLTSTQRAAYKAATVVGTGTSDLDLEKLAALKPDVIVIGAPASTYAKLKNELTAIAPTVLLGFTSDWKFRTNALAEATNKIAANDKQRAHYNELVTQIEKKYGPTLNSAKVVEAYRTDNNSPGQFGINTSLCAEVVRDEGIVDFAPATPSVSFEQISSLAKYELILYNANIDGKPNAAMNSLLDAGAWKALPAVRAGHAQPVYCPWGRSFGYMSEYLEGLERALATLPNSE